MRPSDENQPGSRRPNLMSAARRGAGENSILAMLDGQSARALSKRFPALPALLAYAAAGTAACALVGILAWLAHEGMDRPAVAPEHENVAAAAATGAEPAHADSDAPLPAGGAAIVETPPPEPAVVATRPGAGVAAVPPLVTPAAAAVAVPAIANADPPARPAASPVVTPAHAAPRSTSARPALAYRPAPAPAPARGGATLARAKRPVATPKAVPVVDVDVALITAIIQHAARPADAGASCADQSCGPRMPAAPEGQ